jgi:hypothetical protein
MRYLSRYHSRKEILISFYEILRKSKKQDLTPIYGFGNASDGVEEGLVIK